MRPIIRIENLGKQYCIGTRREPYLTLREAMIEGMSTPLRWLRGERASDESTIWALKDINFEIQPGEVVGIIGRNGAGKSTLLKVLSRIIEPTAGTVDLYGRVGSLLEVGAGFHSELTGRENIFLYGVILGMRRNEIQRRFDEIVDFAQVEQFLDTAVKHYSSGMYMRLAFAVAAYLDTEILLVDEILAVGDAEFQKKCQEKMYQVGVAGRAILFVSHNMSAMRSLCTSGVMLQKGALVRRGEINEVVDYYLTRTAEEVTEQKEVETSSFIIHEVQISSTIGTVIKTFDSVEIRVRVTAKTRVLDIGLYVGFLTTDHHRLIGLDLKDFCSLKTIDAEQQVELGFTVENLPLLPGTYQLEVHLKDMAHYRIELVPGLYYFDIAESPVYGGRKIDRWYGHIGLKAKAWQKRRT